MMAVESEMLHPRADRGIEGAIGFFSDRDSEMNGAEEQGTDPVLLVNGCAEPTQFAGRVEPGAILLDPMEPGGRRIEPVCYRASVETTGCGRDDAKLHHGAHRSEAP
jgi:hypothetical protein